MPHLSCIWAPLGAFGCHLGGLEASLPGGLWVVYCFGVHFLQYGSLLVQFGVHLRNLGCQKVKTKATTLIFLKRMERGEFPPARRRTRARARARACTCLPFPRFRLVPPARQGTRALERAQNLQLPPLAVGQRPPAFQSFDRLPGWPQALRSAPWQVDRLESRLREALPEDSIIFIYGGPFSGSLFWTAPQNRFFEIRGPKTLYIRQISWQILSWKAPKSKLAKQA